MTTQGPPAVRHGPIRELIVAKGHSVHNARPASHGSRRVRGG